MGCDIDYYLDHDFLGLSAQDFLAEFKRRVSPLPVVLTGMEESPYTHNQPLSDCWEIDCFLYDFETAFSSEECGINLRLYKNGIPRGWELSLYPKVMNFFSYSDDFNFLHNTYRWRQFVEEYLMNRDAEIERNITTTLNEIEQNIVPIFHCKKMIALGDQGLHQDISVKYEEGMAMEEAFECDAVKTAGSHVVVYHHGDGKRFTDYKKDRLPVWMHEFGGREES